MSIRDGVAPKLILVFACALVAWPRTLMAQKTGTLAVPSTKQLGPEAATESELNARRNRTVALFDPQLSTVGRASATSFNVVIVDSVKEARVQLNVSDLMGAAGSKSAFEVTLAGPIDGKRAADLADLTGLVGKARIEGGYTYDIASTGQRPLSLQPTLKAIVSHPSYAWRSQSTLADESGEFTEYSVEAGVALRWRNSASLAASFDGAKSHTEQNTQKFCAPASFGPAGTLACDEAPVGAPAEKTAQVLNAELKAAFGGVAAVGIALKRDVRANVNALELPVYFLASTTDGAAAGIRLGWKTGAKAPTATVFVNAFKL